VGLIGAPSEGFPLAGGSDELRVLLKGFIAQTGSRMCAIVTRSGVTVASALPDDLPVDNFATMAATLLGALEVIYSSTKGPSPQEVTIQTETGNLVLRVVTPKVFFVALTDGSAADVSKHAEETATRARALLAKPS
jgi:predicted regulator of Ras-like GTPase activity (Roadblock/LC7/MglB family)